MLASIKKGGNFRKSTFAEEVLKTKGIENYRIVLFFNEGADLTDLFSLFWLLGGNLEPDRYVDILKSENGSEIVFVDATFKTENHDNFKRDWPNVVTMNAETIDKVDKRWSELGLGEFISSPSLKYLPLVKGEGAVRNQE